jgi:hypothetical protein
MHHATSPATPDLKVLVSGDVVASLRDAKIFAAETGSWAGLRGGRRLRNALISEVRNSGL